MAAAQQFPTLTFEQAKEALDEVIAAFEQPDAMAKVSANEFCFIVWCVLQW